MAGSADFKNDLNKTDMFDPRLQVKVVNIIDVSYGFENGLSQAIEKSAESLLNVKFMKIWEVIITMRVTFPLLNIFIKSFI